MAGNKLNTKTKGKEDKSKGTKVDDNSEDPEGIDFTLLRKPIHTAVTGFAQAKKIFDFATEELRNLLTNECDLLYECKVCRNIFRSLINFISHKRVYCKEKFNSAQHVHFTMTNSTEKELLQINFMEKNYQLSLTENSDDRTEKETDDRIPMTKDLTAIIENISKTKGICQNGDDQQMVLQKIPNSSVAVFQNIKSTSENLSDNMQTEVNELDHILSRDRAVLQEDGKFKVESSKRIDNTENVIQISDDEDVDCIDTLKCKICDLLFSTQKTLKFHMKYKHLESRLVYPCPDCLEIFSTSWSVYRHLFKVHRKSAAQIRKLRESIQAKAFRMNNPPSFYEKRKNLPKPTSNPKITEEERLDQENQAWMEDMEGDCGPRCRGCGRTFERRAALHAHTHTCLARAPPRRPPDPRRIQIQIRRDYNKAPRHAHAAADNKPLEEAPQPVEPRQNDEPQQNHEPRQNDEAQQNDKVEVQPAVVNSPPDHNMEESKPEEVPKTTPTDTKPVIRLPFAQHIEKNNLNTFKQRIQSSVHIQSLLCKKCDVKQKDIQELYDHMADHYKWMRYACKLCNFKHYDFEKLPEHVKVVHKLKGDPDFYCSTIKAIDGAEALELSEFDEPTEPSEISPDSRRPSRCSSDSSRLSDDSSSSSIRTENNSRKRKRVQNNYSSKKKKDPINTDIVNDDEEPKHGHVSIQKVMNEILGVTDNTSIKSFEENSSDLEDIEDKAAKNVTISEKEKAIATRRPVRKRTKRKNEDFEYDLSNLLKMEAQGYRDSLAVLSSKSNQNKKKVLQENEVTYENINKDNSGALAILSKRAVAGGLAHLKSAQTSVFVIQKDRFVNTFARPMLPKTILKAEKISPKKEVLEEVKCTNKIIKPTERLSNSETTTDDVTNSSSNKVIDSIEKVIKSESCIPSAETKSNPDKAVEKTTITKSIIIDTDTNIKKEILSADNKETKKEQSLINKIGANESIVSAKREKNQNVNESPTNNLNKSTPIPFKFHRQGLEVIKNPIINKNITEFTKAGMKTKILVIKPINRNKDGVQSVNNRLKFQTIKIKDSSKINLAEDKSSDQVVVVKVPNVESSKSDADKSKLPNLTNSTETPPAEQDNQVAKLSEIHESRKISTEGLNGESAEIIKL